MDWSSLIKELGGGAIAVMLVISWAVIFALWKRLNEVQDKLHEVTITMGKENRDLLTATNTTISAATGAIAAAVQRIGGQ